jgi:pyridoxal phosphate enzyme (YggS family)
VEPSKRAADLVRAGRSTASGPQHRRRRHRSHELGERGLPRGERREVSLEARASGRLVEVDAGRGERLHSPAIYRRSSPARPKAPPETMTTTIEQNLREVRARIAAASARAGRAPESVTLVAVSKKQPVDALREAYAAGCRDFGENYAQELLEKASALVDVDLRLHHIGHLQTNKVKALVGKVALFHGVDRTELVRELDKRAGAAGCRASVLIQVNVAGEDTKSGCTPVELPSLVAEALACPHLEVRGLMTMPPPCDDPEAARPHFRELRRLRDALGDARLDELSMGMSHDFEVAIEEGATLVRVGTAIFGARG